MGDLGQTTGARSQGPGTLIPTCDGQWHVQFIWIRGNSGIWSDIPGVSTGVFWMRSPYTSVGFEKTDCPPYHGWAPSDQLKAQEHRGMGLPRQGALQQRAPRLPAPLWTGHEPGPHNKPLSPQTYTLVSLSRSPDHERLFPSCSDGHMAQWCRLPGG